MGLEKKFNFTYQTKNLINGKLYVGVHSTDKLDDGYIGCGIHRQSSCNKPQTSPLRRAVKKYGYKNFKMEILAFFDTKEEAYEEEAWLVDEKWVNRKDTYNVQLGGKVNKTRSGILTRDIHPSSKKVKNKVTGEIYTCIEDLADYLGVKSGYIGKKLNGSLYNDTDYEFLENPVQSKRINKNMMYYNLKQYDKQGQLINEFKDIKEATKKLSLNRMSLANHLRGNRTEYLGYVWTSDHLKGKPTNTELGSWYNYELIHDTTGEIHKFKTHADICEFLGYSRNSTWRLFNRFKAGKPHNGYMFYDRTEGK